MYRYDEDGRLIGADGYPAGCNNCKDRETRLDCYVCMATNLQEGPTEWLDMDEELEESNAD